MEPENPSSLDRGDCTAETPRGSLLDFDAVFGGMTMVEFGEPVDDPLAGLTPRERAEYRAELEDIVLAQRHAETLGASPRRAPLPRSRRWPRR